jgi:hypothetical protein
MVTISTTNEREIRRYKNTVAATSVNLAMSTRSSDIRPPLEVHNATISGHIIELHLHEKQIT